MPKNESSQSLEFLHAEVCKERSLVAFVTFNADSDLGGLDHVDVVTSISDCHCERIGLMCLNECDDLCILVWAASEHHH